MSTTTSFATLNTNSAIANNTALQGLSGKISLAPLNAVPGVTVPSTVRPGAVVPSHTLTSAPVSPITKSPVPAYGSTASTSTSAPYNSVGHAATITPSGSMVSTDYNGNITSPSNFSIDTSGAIPSSALATSLTRNDVTSTQKSYADYVQNLYAAQQYSPGYLAALEASQAADAKQAELGANFYTGNNLPGDTLDYAQGATAKAQELNSLKQLQAKQGLNNQELIRQGNIAGAKALVDASAPSSVSPGSSLVSPLTGQTTYGGTQAYTDLQAQQTYSNLQQTYPDASIPPYDTSVSPQQNLQNAQSAAAQAPSFQSKNIIPVTLPGGGYGLVNKNQVAGYRSDGTAIVISPAQASQAEGYQASIKTLTDQAAQIQSASSAADSNFSLLLQTMKQGGINDYSSPLLNQVQQKINSRVLGTGAQASVNALVASLSATYSQILGRGYAPTESVKKEAGQLINGTYSYSTLANLYQTLKQESNNVLNGINQQKTQSVSSLNSLYNTTTQTAGSTGYSSSGGSVWDF